MFQFARLQRLASAAALAAVFAFLAPAGNAVTSSAGVPWGWGAGALGNGRGANGLSLREHDLPAQTYTPAGVTFAALSAGTEHALALAPDGAAWSWGANFKGELGDGSPESGSSASGRFYPGRVQMPSGVTFTSVAAGDMTSLALAADGTAWSWGANFFGQLGDGTTHKHAFPMPVSVPAGVTFVALAAGGGFSLAIDTSGNGWAWGNNPFGQLGDDSRLTRLTPVQVHMPAGERFSAVAGGAEHSLAVAVDGTVWGWGHNFDGELGNGSTADAVKHPVEIAMPPGVSFTAVAAGGAFSLALATDGSVWAWGVNSAGQLGNGTTSESHVPVEVSMPAGVRFTSISASAATAVALASDGSVWAWGANAVGELGDGTTSESHVPVRTQLPAGLTATAVSAGGLETQNGEFGLALVQPTGSQPTLSGFTPHSAVVGKKVTLTGSRLADTTAVEFDGMPASFQIVSDTTLRAVVPDGATDGPIDVANSLRNVTMPGIFKVKPTIAAFRPTSGPVGTQVTISGSALTGVTRVTFNGVVADNAIPQPDGSVQAEVAPGSTTGPVTLTTKDGTATSSTDFAVTP